MFLELFLSADIRISFVPFCLFVKDAQNVQLSLTWEKNKRERLTGRKTGISRSTLLPISSRFCCLTKQFSPGWREICWFSVPPLHPPLPCHSLRPPKATSYCTGARRSAGLDRFSYQKPTDSIVSLLTGIFLLLLDTSFFTQVPMTISRQCQTGNCYD